MFSKREEAAARLLRQADHRRQMVAGIIATWPKDPKRRTKQEWESLELVLPDGASKAEVRNRSRQVLAFAAAQGHLPQGLEELEDQPQVFPQVLLSACDRQAVTLTRTTGSSATLRVQLPKSGKPRSRKDWSWVSIPVRLPPTVPEAAERHTPTLRVKAGRVLVDLPFTVEAPVIPRAGHQVGIPLRFGAPEPLPSGITCARRASSCAGRSPTWRGCVASGDHIPWMPSSPSCALTTRTCVPGSASWDMGSPGRPRAGL
ncbi:MAG TPA: hypothetical protein VNF75_02405 [Candidatus Dormibacteraeota bacterium]|nr:hypothetical protein [Candidatus Dormibacteraeota bacterium]